VSVNQTRPWSPAAFEARFAADPDPWSFRTSAYERSRYSALLSALGGRRFERALEPGCANGELTAQLATTAERVIAFDVSPTAAALARERCAALAGVTIDVRDLRDPCPPGPFDLVVLSEVGYYFTSRELDAIGGGLVAQLAPGGALLAGHWQGRSADHRLHGDEVHAVLDGLDGLRPRRRERHPGFRVDVWERA